MRSSRQAGTRPPRRPGTRPPRGAGTRPSRLAALPAAALAAFVVAGCAGGSVLEPAAQPTTLTIYAAASLGGAMDRIKPAYEQAHPGTTIVVSVDSSAALATKIEQGAPADVFLSADVANPQRLIDGGLATGPATVFVTNALALIVPTGNPAGVGTPADLARPGVRIIAAGDTVPITSYANRLIENLARLPGYPGGFVAACAANIVSREEHVSAVAAKIELGEGDAAIVYRTDALASTGVHAIEIPDEANVRSSYAAVVVGASTSQLAGRAFIDWLAGPEGQMLLSPLGFSQPEP